MKIKTIEALQDKIDEDLSWRKKELIDFSLMIHSSHNESLCRAGIALLSAHFEGFIKSVSNMYLVYVSSQGEKLSNLKNNFTAISCARPFKDCIQSEKISVRTNALNNVMEKHNNEEFRIKYSERNPIISTDSNPSSKVLREIILSIGLDYSEYETKSRYIDTDLLSNRHKIVHGERISIEESDFDNTYENILEIMTQFSRQVLQAATDKEYLRHA